MKIRIISRHSKAGYALLMALFFTTIAMIVLAATMKRTATTALLNERENQYYSSFYAAEAAVEKAVGQMLADYQQGQAAYIQNNIANYRVAPTSSESSYWTNFAFSDGAGTSGTRVQLTITGATNWVEDQTDGLNRWRTIYRVLSNAKQLKTRFNITNAAQQDMAMDSIPVFQFAIFYNSALEFTWAAPLKVRGRVHANGPIYTGVSSSSSLSFTSLVTTTSTISKKSLGGYQTNVMTGPETFSGGKKTNVTTLSLPVGTNNVREILNIPPSGEALDSALGTNRFYNKAAMVLLISNNTVRVIIKSTAADSSPTNLTYTFTSTNYSNVTTNLPFLSLTNSFYDQRESKTNKVTQIDMSRLRTWAATNVAVVNKRPSSNPFNILYVSDNRTVTSQQLDVVRLVNGTNLPSFGTNGGVGFTVATPNPLYILGHYNATNNFGTTNTSATVPASVVADSLTILSSAWRDTNSTLSYSARDPADTTINAAILTGIVYSTGTSDTTFSGGVHNLPRLLEDWNSHTLTLNTSIVNLFQSAYATNQFKLPGNYYSAPNRNFSFDVNFFSPGRQPPGAPMVGQMKRYMWASPPPNKINYAGP